MTDKHKWRRPPKNIPVGTLVRFVAAPPRFTGESPRSPGNDNQNRELAGQLAVTVTRGEEESHGWGGIFHLHTVLGDSFSHYGDFLEVADESR